LDVLNIAGVHLEFRVVLIAEVLRAGLINLEDVLSGDLLSGEHLLTLLEDGLVELVVLELEGTVESLLLLVDLSLLILSKVGLVSINEKVDIIKFSIVF
jgi:hypothetical protein